MTPDQGTYLTHANAKTSALPDKEESPPAITPRSNPVLSRRHDMLIAMAILVTACAVVLVTGGERYGLSWDEAYYYTPSRKSALWVHDVLFTVIRPLSANAIDEAWAEIRELPPVVKVVMGTFSLLLEKPLGPLASMRIHSALAYAMTAALIYLFLSRDAGRAGGLCGAAAWCLMPRVFGHAHIGAAETTTAFMSLAAVYTFVKGLESPRWSIVFGVVFALALNTKINCVFLPLVLIPWAHVYHRGRYANNVFSMIFLSPPLMVATWPWLWPDPAVRFLEYLYFFVTHQMTAVFYFGRKFNYGGTPAPWHYPVVMTLIATPPAILLLAAAGAAGAIRRIVRDDRSALALWGFTVMMSVAMLPNSPKYDGLRLFIPALMFLALLSGWGMQYVIAFVSKRAASERDDTRARKLGALCILLTMVSCIYGIARYHPHELSYFNIFMGGIRGAYEKGMETTYWGEAVNKDIYNALNELPKGARIKTLALHARVFEILQEWGRLRGDLRFNEGDPPWDYHLLSVRKGFFGKPEWMLYAGWEPLKVWSHQEVPLVILSRTGLSFEQVWPYYPEYSEQNADAIKKGKDPETGHLIVD